MSWEQLQAIQQEAEAERRAELAAPPQACPNDGEPLEPGREPGTLHCPFDGYTWPQ
jgi:hypothetical protein